MPKEMATLTLISGNSSGDLDSLISSYVLGTLRALEDRKGEKTEILFHFPRDEWRLHREAAHLFGHCGSELGDILFLDDLPGLELPFLSKNNKLNIVLTDHNYAEEDLRGLKCIREIIDHHQILTPLDTGIASTISNTGSCSTLIAEIFFSILLKKPLSIDRTLKNELANLLYFTIRIDTDNLEENGQYDLQRDRAALHRLSALITMDPAFIADLKKEKKNFSGFSMEDYLHKDYKSRKCDNMVYGISTVHISIDTFSRKFLEFNQIISFMKKKGISILFMMHSLREPILLRELSVFLAGTSVQQEDFIQRLKKSVLFTKLQSTPSEGDKIYFFSQLDPGLSRKKIQPYLEQLMKSPKE